MRLLQINCWYDQGSTGKLVQAIQKFAIQQGHESYVLYGLGEKIDDGHAFRVTPWIIRKAQSFWSRITGYPYGGCIWGTYQAIKYMKKIKPDIVHIQCMNGYMVNIYKILDYLKKEDIPTVITNHAEFMYTGGCTHALRCDRWLSGCGHCDKIGKEHPISYFFDRTAEEWRMLQQSYNGFQHICICNVSGWLTKRAQKSPFYKKFPIKTVLNGVNTENFTFHSKNKEKIRGQFHIPDKPTVIHVTAGFDNPIKGGKHVTEMAKRFPEFNFFIVGDAQQKSGYPSNMIFTGPVRNQYLLGEMYSLADICLLTSVKETFSMVTVESLCCGTPVIGFEAGGPEDIALPAYSVFVEQGNDEKLASALNQAMDKNYDKKKISQEAVQLYSDNTMCENYFYIYENLLQKIKNKKVCHVCF